MRLVHARSSVSVRHLLGRRGLQARQRLVHSGRTVKRTGENGESVLIAPGATPASSLTAQEILVGASLLYTAGRASAGASASSRRPMATGASRSMARWSTFMCTTRSTTTPQSTCSPSTRTAAPASARGCSSRRSERWRETRGGSARAPGPSRPASSLRASRVPTLTVLLM